MRRVLMSAGVAVVLSLGLLAAPGLAAQGTGTTATGEVTDSWLTFKTKLALLADERISSTEVSVKTVKGVITLHGKVASAEEQKAAEEIALKIEGQKKVVNQLTVVPAVERKMVDRQDDQLVTDVKTALTKEAALQKASIEVRAEKGIVTLTGKAPSLATSVRASEVARRVSGVRAVRNELALPARAAASDRAPAATAETRPTPSAKAATSRVDPSRPASRCCMAPSTSPRPRKRCGRPSPR